ncbi:MAG: Respiratory nitrate reductase 1 beta chain [Candidatus Heimdallarchaeota archaeon LC_3]|nr:MAG: Respiratory nitrate reductase 1 beta chain [Candidatus Heimdallarchaeota archaeon LC_3]
MVFHLDKCIGCHTCSIACKNIWSDRKGTEYMWWNNVETKPGTGYPDLWEDQNEYRGGFEVKNDKLKLKLQSRLGALRNIFFNPYLPTMDDYYEPWTYDYQNLFNAPAGNDQPTARPISMVTGKPMEINSGPNWDDDLGGSTVYAANDINLKNLTDEEKKQLNELERLVFFYLPRICNHCTNPACVAACPAGAIYKRGEDGIVLISQDKCRAWRMCISGCPYKKVYYNWSTGKSEKCILCFPRLETGQAPACFHSCVGRIRYLGILLYDADQIENIAKAPEKELVKAQRTLIKDPNDPIIRGMAKESGIPDNIIEYAVKSPVYQFVKEWELALPLHPEFRTLPMLFYVPPLLPVIGKIKDGETYNVEGSGIDGHTPLMSSLENSRVPIEYMGSLFSAGNIDVIKNVLRKLIAVRIYTRSTRVKDIAQEDLTLALKTSGLTPEIAEAIFHLTSKPTYDERFVIPPLARESGFEEIIDPFIQKAEGGFGIRQPPKRSY